MKYLLKYIALFLMLWTPLFFAGAVYAATQMEISNIATHSVNHQAVSQVKHACHEDVSSFADIHQDTKPAASHHQCQHCSFCAGFVSPLAEVLTVNVIQIPVLATHVAWIAVTHQISPDHRPPIDA